MSSNIDSPGGVQRRRRGAARLSCAECRRLKLRCDRKVPCESCVKRGCAAICPDGSLTTGKGNRFVLASTTELHEKISELCQRVRDLEDALRTSHAYQSTQAHPLLSDDLLKIKAPLQRENSDRGAPSGGKEDSSQEVVDSFGSLSISQTGKTKFYGHTANSWYFLQNESPEEESEDRTAALESVLPPEILALGQDFPTSPTNSPVGYVTARYNNLVGYLPSLQKAMELRDIYYQRAAWMYNPISRAEFDQEVFQYFFNETFAPPSPPSDSASSHRLALMFIVLAIGTLMDPHEEPYSINAEKFHQLARAALFKSSFFDDPTLHAVQALFLMSYYLFLADRHGTGSGSRWIIMGFAVKLAQSIGLHRDSTRWRIEETETQTRRETFWELYTYDSWQCLTFGRPPSFSLPHVDCKFPHPVDDPTGDRSFDTWKHRFSAECMSVVHDQAFGAKSPSYQTILQLDRKLRAFAVPPVLQVAGFGSSEPGSSVVTDTLELIMQRHIVLALREMNLLYMHRGFFARAIGDNQKDPLGSPFGTSVIAAYRSAGSLVALVRDLDSQLPEPTERLWFLWTHLFSCAIILGSIVTRCPSMSLAPSALVQLDSACELFERVAEKFRAGKVLSIMQNLRQKAHSSLRENREGRSLTSFRDPMSSRVYADGEAADREGSSEDDDELLKFGGKTRLISAKEKDRISKSPSPVINTLTRSPNTHNPIVPLPLGQNLPQPVKDYLYTFNFQGSQGQANMYESKPLNGSLGEAANVMYSPVGANIDTSASGLHYATSPTSSTTSPTLILPSPHTAGQGGSQQHQQQQQQSYTNFPPYFPVFDYGSSSIPNSAGAGTSADVGRSPYPVSPMHSQYEQDTTMEYVGRGHSHASSHSYPHAHSQGHVGMNGGNLNGLGNMGGMNGVNGVNGINGMGMGGMEGINPMNGGMGGSYATAAADGRRDLSPDTSVQGSWFDFVHQMSTGMGA